MKKLVLILAVMFVFTAFVSCKGKNNQGGDTTSSTAITTSATTTTTTVTNEVIPDGEENWGELNQIPTINN